MSSRKHALNALTENQSMDRHSSSHATIADCLLAIQRQGEEIAALRRDLLSFAEQARSGGKAATSRNVGKAEAARLLGCSPKTVDRYAKSGRLQAAKLAHGGSSRVLITRESIEKLLEESKL